MRKFSEYGDAYRTIERHKEEYNRFFFEKKGYFIKDHSFIHDGSRWHLFYIRGKAVTREQIKAFDARAARAPGLLLRTRIHNIWELQADLYIGHATTRDFTRWEVHAPLPFDGAPYVFRWRGAYYLFFNAHPRKAGGKEAEEKGVCIARSDDLFHWTPLNNSRPVYAPDNRWYIWPEFGHCRDYHVIEHGGKIVMFHAALAKGNIGCVGAAVSEDMVHWKGRPPLFKFRRDPQRYTQWDVTGYGIPESPFVVRRNGFWHLFVTSNDFPTIWHFWSKNLWRGWSKSRSQRLLPSPNEYSGGPNGAANEFLKTEYGDLMSFYFYDVTKYRTVLALTPVGWSGPIPYLK